MRTEANFSFESGSERVNRIMALNDLTALTGILSVCCKKILKPLRWVWRQMPFLKQTADEWDIWPMWDPVMESAKQDYQMDKWKFPFHVCTWQVISNNFKTYVLETSL